MHKFIRLAVVLGVMALLLATAAQVMADGPGNNGQGGDPSFGDHPPNDVWVPQKAFDARGPNPPGNPDNSHAAIFHPASGGGEPPPGG